MWGALGPQCANLRPHNKLRSPSRARPKKPRFPTCVGPSRGTHAAAPSPGSLMGRIVPAAPPSGAVPGKRAGHVGLPWKTRSFSERAASGLRSLRLRTPRLAGILGGQVWRAVVVCAVRVSEMATVTPALDCLTTLATPGRLRWCLPHYPGQRRDQARHLRRVGTAPVRA